MIASSSRRKSMADDLLLDSSSKSGEAGDLILGRQNGPKKTRPRSILTSSGLNGSGQQQHQMDKNLRLRSMLAMPPSTSSRAKFPSKNGSRDRLLMHQRNASEPSLLNRLPYGAGQSSGNLSTASSTGSSSSNCCKFKGNAVMQVAVAQRSTGSASVKSRISELQGITAVSPEEPPCCVLKGNAVMQVAVAQRSNGGTVKSCIAELQRITAVAPEEPPLDQIFMLAQWASVDAYYKVVISKYQGIPAIIQAMDTFPMSADLQACGCSALKSLSNKSHIHTNGGVSALLNALRNHPASIVVQSEALDALKQQGPMLSQESPDTLRQLIPLLRHAKDMYLTQRGKEGVLFLFQYLATYRIQMQAATAAVDSPTAAAATAASIENDSPSSQLSRDSSNAVDN